MNFVTAISELEEVKLIMLDNRRYKPKILESPRYQNQRMEYDG